MISMILVFDLDSWLLGRAGDLGGRRGESVPRKAAGRKTEERPERQDGLCDPRGPRRTRPYLSGRPTPIEGSSTGTNEGVRFASAPASAVSSLPPKYLPAVLRRWKYLDWSKIRSRYACRVQARASVRFSCVDRMDRRSPRNGTHARTWPRSLADASGSACGWMRRFLAQKTSNVQLRTSGNVGTKCRCVGVERDARRVDESTSNEQDVFVVRKSRPRARHSLLLLRKSSIRMRRILQVCACTHVPPSEQLASPADGGRAIRHSSRSTVPRKTMQRREPHEIVRTRVHRHSTRRARGREYVDNGKRSHHGADACGVGLVRLPSPIRDEWQRRWHWRRRVLPAHCGIVGSAARRRSLHVTRIVRPLARSVGRSERRRTPETDVGLQPSSLRSTYRHPKRRTPSVLSLSHVASTRT